MEKIGGRICTLDGTIARSLGDRKVQVTVLPITTDPNDIKNIGVRSVLLLSLMYDTRGQCIVLKLNL